MSQKPKSISENLYYAMLVCSSLELTELYELEIRLKRSPEAVEGWLDAIRISVDNRVDRYDLLRRLN